MIFDNEHIELQDNGYYRIYMGEDEKELLTVLTSQARHLILKDDPATKRLFPPAHMEGGKYEDEYREMAGNELKVSHLDALNLLESTATKDYISREELERWLSAVEILRLLLGTKLAITEDMDYDSSDVMEDPQMALYHYLTWLQDKMVIALMG